jgi:predicted nucleotidyltransferase
MGHTTEKADKILEQFYEYPGKEFTIRELARQARMPKSTVQEIVTTLKKNELVSDNKAAETSLFKKKKTHFFIEKLYTTGLIDYLLEQLSPTCILLFGSVRKGESDKESDIDIFVETTRKKQLTLTKFEKLLKHPIQLFVSENLRTFPENLRNNIHNGIKLEGILRIHETTDDMDRMSKTR